MNKTWKAISIVAIACATAAATIFSDCGPPALLFGVVGISFVADA